MQRLQHKRAFVATPGILVLLASAIPLVAQTASVEGTVRDKTGSLIPAATVTALNAASGEKRIVTTNLEGAYTIPQLPPGVYNVTVTSAGFKTNIEKGVELDIDDTVELEFKLELGAVNESIEVTASAPVLNTENATKGEVMVADKVIEMPLNGRDFNDLTILVPGVAPIAQGGNGSAIAINGARSDNTNFVIDGFNDQNPRGGTAQARPNIDALQEYKLQTSNYSAETGRLAGGVMNMVLKSGGNHYHGTLFEFVRNDLFDARNFFDSGKPELRRNQYGGLLSGPVNLPRLYRGQDRTFFLLSWESYRQVATDTLLSRVPTLAERSGNFSADGVIKDPLLTGTCSAKTATACFPGSIIPASRLSPIALRIQPFYPSPNIFSGLNNFRAQVKDPDQWDSVLMKIDQRLKGTDNVSYRFLDRHNRSRNPFNGSDTGLFGNTDHTKQCLMGLNYLHIFRSDLINEARLGFTRTETHQRGYLQGYDYASYFGIPGVTTDPKLIGIPHFAITGIAALGDANNMPVDFVVNNFEYADTLTWVKGRHVVKGGFSILHTQFNQPYNNNNRGTLTITGSWTTQPYADFLLGLLNASTRQVGVTNNYFRLNNYSSFIQDDWKITSRLTLNLGLRYEIPVPAVDKYGHLTNFSPDLGMQLIAVDPGIAAASKNLLGVGSKYGYPDSLVFPRYNDLAPRLGFAWRPKGLERLVIRGGYGIFFGNQEQNDIRNALANVFPYVLDQSFARNASKPDFLTLSSPFPTGSNTMTVNGYDPHAKTPSLQSYNMTLERQLGARLVLEIAYVGSKGTHLGRQFDLNQPFRIPGSQINGNFPRPFNAFGTVNFYSFNGNSIYNSGIVTLRKRISRGFFYTFNYVYAKSIDTGSQLQGNGAGGVGVQNSRNLNGERGRSDFDIGHNFTSYFSYEVPARRNVLIRGWQVAGTTQMHTGAPFTPKVTNVNLTLGEANRPDRIAKGTVANPSTDLWFDPTAFPQVPTGSFRFGDAGRNILDGPGLINVNLSLYKNLRFEHFSTQFRWETFNILNHANFNLPENTINAVNVGTITGAKAGRQMQFGLRLIF
jgi:outer membrane receptor protein involved in Fe transport